MWKKKEFSSDMQIFKATNEINEQKENKNYLFLFLLR